MSENKELIRATMKRCIIYCRVSTTKQAEEGTSLEVQTDDGLKHAHEQGYTVIEIVCEDYTGSLYRERKELSRIRKMARNHEFDVLIFRTFDRLSRNQTHLAVLIDEMEYYGVKIDCVKEKLEDSPAGKFLMSAMGFMAEVERLKIMDRTNSGKQRLIQEGKLPISWKPRYGFKWVDEAKLQRAFHETEAAVVMHIFYSFVSVRPSLHGIAAMLTSEGIPTPTGNEIWNKVTVFRILTDPMYTGKAYANKYSGKQLRPKEEWTLLPDDTIPALISEEMFNEAQAVLRINKEESLRNNFEEGEELLRCGFIKCGYCKRAMTINRQRHKTRKTQVVYRCGHTHTGSAPRCPYGPSINTEIIDPIVWEYVGAVIQDFSLVELAIKLFKDSKPGSHDIEALENSLAIARINEDQLLSDLNQKIDGLPKLKGRARDAVLDDLSKIEDYVGKLEREKAQVLAGQMQWQEIELELDRFIAWCLQARDTYHTATYEEKRRAIRSLGIVVYIHSDSDKEHERHPITARIPNLAEVMLSNSSFLHSIALQESTGQYQT